MRVAAVLLTLGLLIWPVRGPLTTTFSGSHLAIDIAVPSGTPVRAADAGRATWVGWRGGCGRTIMIDHDDGRLTLYCHLSRYLVEQWQDVDRGQVIGLSGSTGYSTGPHLHFGLWSYGQWIDPLEALP